VTIAFRQLITPWSGASPAVSDAFTPVAAGDALIFVSSYYAAAFSGTGTYYQVGTPFPFTDLAYDDWSTGYNLSATAESQTTTATAGTAGDGVIAQGIEYSGVAAVSASIVNVPAPGTGANAIAGTPVTVPTGSVLVALCANANGDADTITTSGTNRGSGAGDFNLSYCWGEWTGAGSSITPTFTTLDGTDNFVVVQWLLTPASSGAALAATPADATAATGALATGIDAAGAASDTSTASGTLVSGMSLAEWDVGTCQQPALQRRFFSDNGAVKCLAGGNVCIVHEIFPVTLGSGTLTIEDQGGAVIFTATTAEMSQGVVIPVGEAGNGILTITSFPTGGEYGMSWQSD
jgi:hypothetical protein